MAERKVLCVVDPNLKNKLGHDFAYDYSLMDPALKQGYEFLVLGHKEVESSIKEVMPTQGAFSCSIWDTYRRLGQFPVIGRSLDLLLSNLRFYLVLRSRLSTRTVTSDWIIFAHMITPHQLLGWAWWVRSLSAHNMPRVVLLFRYSAEWFASNPVMAHAFELLQHRDKRHHVRIVSDSKRLADEYAALMRLPVKLLPIPHTAHPIVQQAVPKESNPGTRLCLVSLGNARDEKGFLEILRAILELHSTRQLDRFKFVLQSNDVYAPDTKADIVATMDEIRRLGLDNVEFIDTVLDTDRYYRLLQHADVVLLPYWGSIYRSRTSGIFAEALAAGKMIIATDDTWMSDQLRALGTGVLCDDRDPQDLARAMLEVEADWQEHSRRAQLAKGAWLQAHNPERLVEAMLGDQETPKRPARVAVLYPWGGLLERRSGASQRVCLLLDYLKEVCEIQVLAPGKSADVRSGNVRYISHHRRVSERVVSGGAQWLYQNLTSRWPALAIVALAGVWVIARFLGIPGSLARGLRRHLSGTIYARGARKLRQLFRFPIALAAALQQRLMSVVAKLAHTLGMILRGTIRPRAGQPGSIMLWLHYQYEFEPSLVRRIEEVVGWADVVLLEYTFWATPVARACHRAHKRLIVTDYDVVSFQIKTSPLLRWLTLRAEVAGLRKADHAVCVSATDRHIFRNQGVDTEVIPHPIDASWYQRGWSRSFTREILVKYHGIQVPPTGVCLFVGSPFPPNVEAAQSIRQIARSLSRPCAGGSAHFVIVGGCAPPEREGNFLALGKVHGTVLRALYQLADLIVIPLRSGTGASVKTIEAMAYGKAILGTQVAFRGIPVVSDVHCVVADDLTEYPRLITSLLCDPDRRRRLGEKAYAFAQAYDYRTVYRRYLDLITESTSS